MAYGITADGFQRKRLDVILAELNQALKAIFGENLNLDPETPDGQTSGVFSESHANLWELAEQAYNAFNPSAATGDVLSNLVQLNGILRKDATFSTAVLTLGGIDTTVIPAGSLVSTADGISFATDADATIVAGTAAANATATVTGPLQAAIGTITEIDTPITGWSTVTNAAAATPGTNEEDDSDLRARRERSIESAAVAILESILAAVLEIENVTDAAIYENDTASVDARGLDPHSFLVLAEGGLDADVAEAIFNKKPTGIGTNGTTTEPVLDSQGVSHDIKFSRPVDVTIHVKVTLVGGPTYAGDDAVKQSIIDYAAGDLIEGENFSLGKNVVYSQMFDACNQPGNDINEISELLIDIVDPPTGTSTITIDFDEKALFETANIDVVST